MCKCCSFHFIGYPCCLAGNTFVLHYSLGVLMYILHMYIVLVSEGNLMGKSKLGITEIFNLLISFSGESFHFYLTVSDCVLPLVGWNHPSDIFGGATTRKICPFYHDPGHIQVRHSFTLMKIKYLVAGLKQRLTLTFGILHGFYLGWSL